MTSRVEFALPYSSSPLFFSVLAARASQKGEGGEGGKERVKRNLKDARFGDLRESEVGALVKQLVNEHKVVGDGLVGDAGAGRIHIV